MGRPGRPGEFRRRVIDLLAQGRSVARVAHDLDVSEQTIYDWRRQDAVSKLAAVECETIMATHVDVAARLALAT